jgi:alpha-mannosidase
MYEDKPARYDSWDIDVYYTEKYWDAAGLDRMEWTELGPIRATLEIDRRVSDSFIRQKMRFYAHSRRIDFETFVDWKEHQHLLKVLFPVDIHTDEATFDIQFGNLTRKVHQNTTWDIARFESCGQKWIDLSEGHYGVSLLNDCKYGHSVKDSCMALTLIKSGIEPNPIADQEEHFFTYALYPHAGNWRLADTVQEAYQLNQHALTIRGGEAGESFSLACVDCDNVLLETVKRAEDGDGTIVRLYETDNARTPASLIWSLPVDSVEECNLLEEPVAGNEGAVTLQGDRIVFVIKPYEVKTFRIR